MAPGQVLETIEKRRSIRKYSGEPVPRRDLLRMLRAATCAPSGGNRQAWLFVVVEGREELNRLAAMIERGIDGLPAALGRSRPDEVAAMQDRFRRFSLFFSRSPLSIFVFTDPSGSKLAAMLAENGYGQAEAENLAGHIELQSAAAAVQNLLLAASDMGYGACWMDPPFFAREELARALGVRPALRLMAIVPVGRPAEVPLPADRKPVESVTQYRP